MPLYEYECRKCRHRLEALQRFSDPPLTECPECGGELKKLLSSPAFQFKGSGWYVTDYAGKKGGEERAGEESGDKAGDKAEKKDAGGADSKAGDKGSGGKSSKGPGSASASDD